MCVILTYFYAGTKYGYYESHVYFSYCFHSCSLNGTDQFRHPSLPKLSIPVLRTIPVPGDAFLFFYRTSFLLTLSACRKYTARLAYLSLPFSSGFKIPLAQPRTQAFVFSTYMRPYRLKSICQASPVSGVCQRRLTKYCNVY